MSTTKRAPNGAVLVLVGMTLPNAMILVDQTAVPLSLPAIMDHFHIGTQHVQWVLSGSLLPLAGLLVLGGKLGDMLGRRRIFLIGAVGFVGGSAVAGLAPTSTCCSSPASLRVPAERSCCPRRWRS